ncbi:MAG: hypothetical protein IJI21_06360 [Clostridia bacterium]|nr:hypothetical protein [Clostridia bacterium]
MRSVLIYNFLIEANILASIAILVMIPLRKLFRKQIGNSSICFGWLLVALRLLIPLTLPNPLIHEIRPAYVNDAVIRPIAGQVKVRVVDAIGDLGRIFWQAGNRQAYADLQKVAVGVDYNGYPEILAWVWLSGWLSRIKLFLLIALSLLLSIAACAEDETVYWINPDGGRYYHLDQNCPSIHPRYLPLPVYLTKEEVADQPYGSLYAPCSVCVYGGDTVPEEMQETGTPTEEPAWKMIVDLQYSEYALTDRYIREAPVFLDEHNKLAKAGRDPEGYSTENRYLQWYQDGKLFREIECKHRDPSRWLYEGIFLSLPDGNVGLAAIEANALNFYRWEEEGLTLAQRIPGK